MRIAYCTNVRFPNERAHGHQIAQVIGALASLGHTVEVYAPFRKQSAPVSSDMDGSALRERVHVTHLGKFDPIASLFLPGVLGLWTLNLLLRSHLRDALKHEHFDAIYTRTPALLPVLVETGIPVILELHTIPRHHQGAFIELAKKCALVVALTTPMLYSLLELGMQPDKLAREGDAVDLDAFGPIPRPEQTRKRFKLPSDVPVIGYAGQLESMKLSKGIPELLGAAEILSKKNVPFHLVIAGGPDAARKKFEKSLPKHVAEHVSFVGLLPATQVPHLLRACDCLVYPAPASNHPFYMRDTSPLKLFEYMAAKQPIVTADLPPIRDVLDDSMATFVPPGDPAALAEAIQQTIEHVEESEKKAKKAFETVQGYTWEKRMERIMQTFTSKELVSAVRSLQ